MQEQHAAECLDKLLTSYGAAFDALGGDRSAVLRELIRLAKLVTKDDVLCNLSESQLYGRLYVHFTSFHGNVLLLAAVMHTAGMYDGSFVLQHLAALFMIRMSMS